MNVSHIIQVTKSINNFLSKAEEAGFSGLNPSDYESSKKIIKEISITKSKMTKKISFQNIELSEKIKFKLELLRNIIDRIEIAELYDDLIKTLKLIDDTLFDYTSRQQEIFEQIDVDLKKVEINKYNITLFTYLLQKNPNEKLIQEIKDKILPPIKEHKRNSNVIQNIIQTHRLTPCGPSADLKEIMEQLGVKTTNFEAASKMLGVGIVVIHKTYPQPKEMNIWNLNDLQYLTKKKLLLSESSGINDVVMKRYATIKEFDTILPNGIIRYGKGKSYFIESIGNMYRMLQRDGKKLIDLDLAPLTRIETYNHILEDEILKHLKEPTFTISRSYDRAAAKAEQINWKKFVERLDKYLLKIVDKDISKLTNEKLIYEYIKSARLSNSISNFIPSLVPLKQEDSEGLINEIQFSYLSDMVKLLTNFERTMGRLYVENWQEKIKKDKKFIRKMFQKLIQDVLEEVITKRSNIQQKLTHKADLINSTI